MFSKCFQSLPEKGQIIRRKTKTFQTRYSLIKPHVGVWLRFEIPLFVFANQNMAWFDVLPMAFLVPFILRYESLSGLLIMTNHMFIYKPCNPNTCAFISSGHVLWLVCWFCRSTGTKNGFTYNCGLSLLWVIAWLRMDFSPDFSVFLLFQNAKLFKFQFYRNAIYNWLIIQLFILIFYLRSVVYWRSASILVHYFFTWLCLENKDEIFLTRE